MPEVVEELLDQLAASQEHAARRPGLVRELRALGVTFDVIEQRGAIKRGTAHRWARQYEKTQTRGEEQG